MLGREIRFNSQMNVSERRAAIEIVEKSANDIHFHRVKRDILLGIIKYANDHLVNPGMFSFTSADRYITCENIFKQIGLPPLYFVQHVIEELNAIPEIKSTLRDSVLPLAQKFRKQMLSKDISQLQTLGITSLVAGIFVDSRFLIPALFFLAASEYIQIWRLSRALQIHLAKPLIGNENFLIGDGMDDELSRLVNSANRVRVSMLGMFERGVQRLPAPQGEAPIIRLNDQNNETVLRITNPHS